jgi:cytochrome c biogenesis protein CcmG, thiol:disulfide interchange protein DsbE
MRMRAAGSLWRDPRQWTLALLVLLILGAGWTWASRVPGSLASQGQIPSPREGFPAPDFTLDSLGGQPTSLSSLRGQVVVINLWASWCGPCQAEMPTIERVYRIERSRGLAVLAVNTTFQDSELSARAFARRFGLTYPILLDREGSVSRTYLLRALPTTYIVDRRGIIRAVVLGGPMAEGFLRSTVEPLVQEAP